MKTRGTLEKHKRNIRETLDKKLEKHFRNTRQTLQKQ